MTQWPTDLTIDQTFPDNSAGDIGADDMRQFQKDMTAAGRDYTSLTENVPTVSVQPHSDQVAYLKDDLVSTGGSIYFAIENVGPKVFDLADWRAVGAATGSGVTMSYEWTITQSGQVPSGQFGLTGIPADVSNTARVSSLTRSNNDVGLFWANVRAGDYVLFIEDTGGAESWLGIATGPSVLQSGTPDWYEIPCDMVNVVGVSEDGRRALVSIITNPSSKVPTGGTTGQVLTKLSNANYDVGWTTP